MAPWEISGRVMTGLNQGQAFTALDWVRDAFRAAVGIEPYPGTLNLQLQLAPALATWRALQAAPGIRIAGRNGACDARCYPVRVTGRYPAAIVRPEVSAYPPDQLELIAAISLRDQLGVVDGDLLELNGPDGRRVSAVVFDVDGTLINSVDVYHIAAGRAAARAGYAVTRAMVRQALNSQEPFWDLVITDPAQRSDELVATLRRDTMRHWRDVLDEHVAVFPGLHQTLQELRAAGVRLAIYTGSQGESFAPLETAGLLDFFEVILTGADVGQAKPHPEGILRCLQALNVAPTEAAYVGDSVPDIGAGRAAGVQAIGVLTGAADSAALSVAGAHRLAADHARLIDILLPDLRSR